VRNNYFVAKLAKGAAATAVIGSTVIPPSQATAAIMPSVVAQESALPSPPILLEQQRQVSSGSDFVLKITQSPSVWDKKLEKEFRGLALQEAKGAISKENMVRLELLSNWRDQLLNPQSVGEILRQMKTDNLLERMENLLKEYVDFQESSGKAGAAT
jgi:hypothetical protein